MIDTFYETLIFNFNMTKFAECICFTTVVKISIVKEIKLKGDRTSGIFLLL